MASTHVAIIGAGLGGLTLARILQVRNPTHLTFTLYEADADAAARASAGGSLDLKYESGQRAMKDAGLHAAFLALCRPVGDQMRVLDRAGRVLLDEAGPGAEYYNPEIDRAQLRALVLDSLLPGTVRWGHKAVAVRRNAGAEGKYAIEFADGSVTEGVDIVVGADGAWSRVRTLVWPGAEPVYSGITFLETKIDVRKHAQLQPLVGGGALFALSQGKGLIAQHNSNGVLMLYSALRVPEEWSRTSAVALADGDAAKLELMLQEFAGWEESLRELVRVGTDATMRPIYALPTDSVPRPRGEINNIVLLGDAAHLMSPFAGEGVNLAMADAADLAKALMEHKPGMTDLGGPLGGYERTMRTRGNSAGKESAANLEIFFGENAAADVAKLFKSFIPDSMKGVANSLVKSYFYLRSLFD